MAALPKTMNHNVSHLFSLEQGRADEAVECTEGSVTLWFGSEYPACWFLGVGGVP